MRSPERQPILRFVPGGYLNGLADLAPPRKIPRIREILTLLWLHGLDGTLITLQEKTGTILPVNQGQTTAVGTEAGVLLNKGPLFHPDMGSNRADLFLSDADKTRPPATGRAALAEIGRRHAGEMMNYELSILKD
jgi:hypothetical protein